MLREGWNFHGDIAIALEGIASDYFGETGRPFTKIYDADAIEQGAFVEVMSHLLRLKTGYSNDCPEIDDFVSRSKTFLSKTGSQIPPEVSQALFDEFVTLFKG